MHRSGKIPSASDMHACHMTSSQYVMVAAQKISIAHASTCKFRGLIIAQHNKMCWEIIHHVVQALSPSSIQDKPLIIQNRSQESSTPTPHQPPKDRTIVSLASHILKCTNTNKPEVIQGNRGDILLCNFLKNGTDAVTDVHITDCDAPSYNNITSKKYLKSLSTKREISTYRRA